MVSSANIIVNTVFYLIFLTDYRRVFAAPVWKVLQRYGFNAEHPIHSQPDTVLRYRELERGSDIVRAVEDSSQLVNEEFPSAYDTKSHDAA